MVSYELDPCTKSQDLPIFRFPYFGVQTDDFRAIFPFVEKFCRFFPRFRFSSSKLLVLNGICGNAIFFKPQNKSEPGKLDGILKKL